ncbi:YjbH domain-containing protein [Jannaschia sp. M317]|uniref:YjbH domain-containing protein n=1 Tax=Jannaschia sp. M317 TaxID=2867011 RepID=UPI0021A70E6B|nr:YjbH domain-containing protein [Jannaschia sp. M317]UWQ18106.1 YjbH domain-containing protein [Jannaschia sp. M317]
MTRQIKTIAMAGLLASVMAVPATPQESRVRSINSYGVPGLIDMPSAQMHPDAELSTSLFLMSNGVGRTTLSFQLTDRLQGVFRYASVPDFLQVGTTFRRTYDRSFDLRYQLFREGRYMPAVTVGLQDFGGTSLYSGEYVVATKDVGERFTVTGGIGWGRFGTNGSFSNPLGKIDERFNTRGAFVPGASGGSFSTDQWFRGPAALFAGVEYRPSDRWTLKAEYSSDAYDEEVTRGIFDNKSPLNFGVEYQARPGLRIGAYTVGGSEIGLNLHFTLNPKRPPNGGGVEEAARPVTLRPPEERFPDAWTTAWEGNARVETVVATNLQAVLAEAGLELISYNLSADRATVRFRNTRYDVASQAIGRAARAMTAVIPASVETFVIIPETENSLAATGVVLRRSDVEALENAPNGAAELLAVAGLVDAQSVPSEGRVYVEDAYPRFRWNIGPFLNLAVFDAENPLRADVGIAASADWEPVRGLKFTGTVQQNILGNREDGDDPIFSALPRVRTDSIRFARADGPTIEQLMGGYYFRPARNLYGRVSAGLLERQYGGVSAELLWKPVSSNLALGLEVNKVRQREFDGGFGFRNLEATTAFASAYWSHGNGFHSQVDVGQYLAGDRGATYRLTREFDNGWKIGAYATKTNVSAADFGEGSFDKGLTLTIPFSWVTGRPSQQRSAITLQPLQRDGGARLRLSDRLYPQVQDLTGPNLTDQWGRVWR